MTSLAWSQIISGNYLINMLHKSKYNWNHYLPWWLRGERPENSSVFTAQHVTVTVDICGAEAPDITCVHYTCYSPQSRDEEQYKETEGYEIYYNRELVDTHDGDIYDAEKALEEYIESILEGED